jgi:hypothetical protein
MNRNSKGFTGLRLMTRCACISIIIASSTAYGITYQRPIIVDKAYIKKHGNVITGNYAGTATQAAITIIVSDNVTITNSNLTGPYDLIQAMIKPANITVTNTTGIGTNPGPRGAVKGIFLHVNTFKNINMQNNIIQGMRLGFFCDGYAGNNTIDESLTINKNIFANIDARPSDGKGAYETTGQYNGQAIHLGNITHVPGMEIAWNEVMNTPFQSSTGALIELNETSGTAGSPLLIHDNYIEGAFPSYPGKDLYGFGGILVNGRPSDTAGIVSSHVHIRKNYVVATANYGISIAAGHDITVNENRVVSSGYLPNGAFYPMSAAYGDAFGAVNSNLYNQAATVFFNNIIENNVLGLIRNDGSNNPVRSDWSLPGQNNNSAGNVNYQPFNSSAPTLADEAQEFINWQQGAMSNNIVVGVN